MTNELNLQDKSFAKYELQFKALADEKRLNILNILVKRSCVGDLSELVDMPQSKLSYHLKILLDAELIYRETKGTWCYYRVNEKEISQLLSKELCCIFRPSCS